MLACFNHIWNMPAIKETDIMPGQVAQHLVCDFGQYQQLQPDFPATGPIANRTLHEERHREFGGIIGIAAVYCFGNLMVKMYTSCCM